ncbi:hypothetical protein VNI00_008498 [Paramarasmius palmivorus]|uniref:F-box domain-containing protein n=1 Tax=Paramarasmius palmivorus TaxID=297713 RepID=A0AAW0CX07_9AGAR
MLESPFCNSFGTNYAPSPPEIAKIRSLLDAPEKQLRALDEEIARLQAQRDELKDFIDNHHALLSPIRRVHTDILREIFVRCLPEDHLPCPNLREAPLLLTRICQRWREVVISTPELWNRIHISLSFPQSPQGLPSLRPLMEKKAQGLEVWLGRSGTMPLTVSFCAVIPSMGSQVGHIWHSAALQGAECLVELKALYVDFAQHLLRYSSRWKSITLKVANCIRELFGRHPFERLGILTEIKISRPREERDATTAHPLATLFKQSPSLRVLHLDEGYFNLPISWQNLTELSLSQPSRRELMFSLTSTPITPSEFLRMLSLSCMSLRRCAANITLTTAVIHDTSLPIVLPYLHTLKLSFAMPLMPIGHPHADATPSQLAFIFDALVAPALTHLYINAAGSTVHPFVNFLERSGCVLKSFEPLLYLPVDGLVELLRAMPYLSDLYLSRTVVRQVDDEQESFADFVSKWLTPSPDTPLLPQLENVSFTFCTPSDAESLLAFAEARCASYDGPCRRLGKMTVSFVHFLTDEEVPLRLQRLRDRGLIVHWSSPQDMRGTLIQSDALLWDGRASGRTDRSSEHIY